MKLIIVRHGETEENVKGIRQGHLPGKLTEKGREQARKLAERFRYEKIDAIFSSDLKRAKDTAKEIARYHNIPVQYTEKLREISGGIYEGKPKEELHEAREKSRKTKLEFRPEEGETFEELKERVKNFLEELKKKYKGKTVLICSHGNYIETLLGILLKRPLEKSLEIKQSNAAVNIVEAKDSGEHEVRVINCIQHL